VALYLWPIPTVAYQIRLETWVSLAQAASTSDSVTVPPAYLKALKLTLAEELRMTWDLPPDPLLSQKAQRARAAIVSQNAKSPRIPSADAGMAHARGGFFNWLTGGPA
jgi:hypothetical protein